MTRQELQNAWYSDATPLGAFVTQVLSGGLLTNRGPVPRTPGGDLLMVRISPDGVRFAGIGQADGHAYEWSGTAWNDLGVAFGNNPVIYDATGTLQVVRGPGTATGATGYRYVEDGTGRLVASWETYDPSTPMSRALGLSDIWEWTTHGDVTIGQGPANVVVKYQGKTYTLYESSNVIMVRFNRIVDAISVAFVDLARRLAGFVWLKVSEIPSLPQVGVPVPAPEPVIPAPVALPKRTPWMAGVCWPIGTAEVVHDLGSNLKLIKDLGVTALRIDAHPGNDGVFDLLTSIAAAGLRPWPIIRMGHDAASTAAFATKLATRLPWITDVELENEPSGHFSPTQYAAFVSAVALAYRSANPSAKLYIACECYDFNTGKAHGFWSESQKLIPTSLYDGVAVHPYRNPHPFSFSAFGSRAKEWAVLATVASSKLLAFTEFGWEGDSGANLVGELTEDRAAACTASFLYAHISRPGDFGLYEDRGDGAWHLTAGGAAVQKYLQAPLPKDPPTSRPQNTHTMKIALSEPAFLNWRWGGGQSLTPPTNPADPNRAAFEHGRKTAGPDEKCEVVPNNDGTVSVRSPNGKSWLSIQGDGSYQERDASKDPGPWERFTLSNGILTELKKTDVTRDPVTLVQG